MKKHIQSQLTLMLTFGLSGLCLADTIDTTGQAPYEQCGYCHEYDGNSRMPGFPKLAGQTPEYIIKQLMDFKHGHRAGQMQATAELLSEEDIRIVAEYFSSQPLLSTDSAESSTENMSRAKQLIHQGDKKRNINACVSCHQNDLKGAGPVPRLAGQHAKYLYDQLKAFQTGERSNDPHQQMRSVSDSLTEQEMKQLSRYLSAMPTSLSQTPIEVRYD